jgi:DNA-binding LytR/AlgR family response regulator
MKTRCLLVDDEPPALEVLRTYIATSTSLEVVGECHHAMEAFDFLQHHPVDLIFLDINMPKLSGTDFIKALPHPPKIIFTTAHREYALDGFELNAVDYLLKPISIDRFLRAVHKALHSEQKASPELVQTESDRFLYFRADRKMVKVMVDDIRYIESLKDYVKIYHSTQPLITKQTITSLEEMLPADDFMRVHRSFIVSLNKISSYSPQAIFIGKDEIPVGPLFKSELTKKLSVIH